MPGAVNFGEIMVWLRGQLPPESIITNGAGNFSTWMHRFYRFSKFATLLGPTSGSMGYGLPAAVGAKRLYPERTVVCVAGDGDFLMNGQEFATAVQYDLPIIVLIMDNGMYGTIRAHQEREFPSRVIATVPAQSGFRRLCARVRRLRRDGGEDRGVRRRVQGREGVGQARDHPPEGRSAGDLAFHQPHGAAGEIARRPTRELGRVLIARRNVRFGG